jgi:hypothetical protein
MSLLQSNRPRRPLGSSFLSRRAVISKNYICNNDLRVSQKTIKYNTEGPSTLLVLVLARTRLAFTCARKSSSTLLQLLARLRRVRIRIFTRSVYRL